MKRRTVHAAFGLAVLGFGLLAAYHSTRLVQARQVNAAIASASVVAVDRSVPQSQIARAIVLSKAGDYEGAMLAYKSVTHSQRGDLRRLALYNLGNLHMHAALQIDRAAADQRLPLIELAKQSYRDLLREMPADWDARYNLERALYLAPEGEEDAADNEPPVPKERSISTVRSKLDLP